MKKNKYRVITLAILLGIATVIIHIINKIIAASAIFKDMLRVSEKNYFNWRFGDIYYTKSGTGTPILLIHDLVPGGSSYEWERIEKKLSMKHTVYSVDLLGCGRSDKPSITYTNFIYVQMITDFVKNVIGEKTDVIACGLSSSFAIMACHNEKEIFNKLMLVNPPSFHSLNQTPTKRRKLLKFMIEFPVFGTLIYNMMTCESSINNLFIEKYYYNPFHMDSDVLDAYYEAAHRNGNSAKFLYASLISKYVNINIIHGLKSIDNSIFIVEGEEEPTGKSIIDSYASANPAIESAIIKRSKHLPHIENPEGFLEQVGIFF